MSVVSGIRGAGGLCEMCMCLAHGSKGGEGACEWIRELGFEFTNHMGTGGVLYVYLGLGLGFGGVGGVGGEWVGSLDQSMKRCGGILSVRVVSPDSLCR